MIRRDFIKSLAILTAAIAAGINPLTSEVTDIVYNPEFSIRYIGADSLGIISIADAGEMKFDLAEDSILPDVIDIGSYSDADTHKLLNHINNCTGWREYLA